MMTCVATRFALSLALSGTCALPAFAQAAREKLSTLVEISADASSVRTEHFERTPLTAAAVAPLSSLRVNLLAGETYEILEAFTRKRDGTRLEVAAKEITTKTGTESNGATFTDAMMLKIAFRDVTPGDTAVATVRTKTARQPPIGGVEGRIRVVPLPEDVDFTYTVTTPARMPLRHAWNGLDHREHADPAGRVAYVWSGHFGPRASSETGVADASFVDPYLEYSTATGWDQIGKDYWSGAGPRTSVTPKIRALADALAGGTQDPREQARRLFDWVADNVRYDAVYAGNGPWVPNAAETVLSRRTGDCKDHAALLTALLAAKGIKAQQALVTTADDFREFSPMRGAIDHVLVYLPEFGVYADPTNPYTAFGQIEPAIAGKFVVLTGPDGTRVARIPVGTAGQNISEVDTHLTLSADRRMRADTTTSATGDFAFRIRGIEALAARDGSAAVAVKMLALDPLPGVPSLRFPASATRAPLAVMMGRVDGSAAKAADTDAFVPPSGLTVFPVGMVTMFGSKPSLPRVAAMLCRPGIMRETITVRLPEGVEVGKLPPSVAIDGPFARFTSQWLWRDGALTIRRELTSTSPTRACPAALAPKLLVFGSEVGHDLAVPVAFTNWPKPEAQVTVLRKQASSSTGSVVR